MPCKISPDLFCYICGSLIKKHQKKHQILSGTKISEAYKAYFGFPVSSQDKPWAPHVCCGSCRSTLEGWLRGSRRAMPFAIPVMWREPTNHDNDCYFCLVDISHFSAKKNNRHSDVVYPITSSATSPVPHSDILPVPTPPRTEVHLEENEQNSDTEACHSVLLRNDDDDGDYSFDEIMDGENKSSKEPHFPNQKELDDLIRDLNLTKSNSELLASRLKEWNLLGSDCKITTYRQRHEDFAKFFEMHENLCFCSNVEGLFESIGISHVVDEWRLFIDSSSRSIKAVLLHKGNKLPSIPVAHSVQLKEDYQNVKLLLQKIKYEKYQWDVCGDFKMLGFLLGLQGGYTKHSCFLCLWDSRADPEHFIRRDWPARTVLIPGRHNVSNEPLVDALKIILPPLHIKLGLIKQYVKALGSTSKAFLEIRAMFPKLSDAKIKAGVFTGPQVRQMFKSKKLEEVMTRKEKNAWQAFRLVVENFLGNRKSQNYVELVENLLKHFHKLGCRMSLKLHYLHSHLDFFRPNLGDVSEEHGERFHQDIQEMEERYQGHWNTAMMGDYIWSLIRSDSYVTHKRKRRSNLSFANDV